MMNANEETSVVPEQTAVDVTSPETHYHIQCDEVRLVSSLFHPLVEEEDIPDETSFSFEIKAFVQENEAYSHLETQVIYFSAGDSQDTASKYFLRFGLMVKFVGDEGILPEEMGDFSKLYTLSILWPYAREYVSDHFRRAGESYVSLPVINPQIVTEQLIEEDLVEVIFMDEEEK
jgi:hypothetical protein